MLFVLPVSFFNIMADQCKHDLKIMQKLLSSWKTINLKILGADN